MIVACKSCHSTIQVENCLIRPNGSWVECSNCQQVYRVFRPYGMDRRKHQRIKTQNLISHISFDKTGKRKSEGIGKALDISMGGMLLETPYPIKPGLLSLMAVDLKENLFETKGRLIYSRKTSSGMYLSGIAFFGNGEHAVNFVIKLVKEHKYRKNSLFIYWYNRKLVPISA